MVISRKNPLQPKKEAPLRQRTNGSVALYGTFAQKHMAFCFLWAVVLTLKQLKNEMSIWACADAVITGLKGKWFEPENRLPDRHHSDRGDGERVRRGRRRGSTWGKASAALQWHQGIGDIILLLYTACCNGLAKLWAGLCGLACPAEPRQRRHRETVSFKFTHHTGSDTLFPA